MEELLNSLETGSSRLPEHSQAVRTNAVNASGSVPGKWGILPLDMDCDPHVSPLARAFNCHPGALILIWRYRHTALIGDNVSTPTTISSVAILPIIGAGTGSHIAALAEGITFNLTNDLAQVSGLRVPSQSTVSDLGKATDTESVRRKLNVDAVVNGTIVNVGDSKLQMELVDVRTGFQLWSQSYTLKQMEEPALAEDIAREISYQIRTRNDKGLSPSRSRKHSSVPAAEAAFVQGQSALTEHTYEGFERAVKFFQQAVDADPAYAAAMAELSRSYALMAINNGRPEPPIELLNQAEATARRALRLDSTLAAAYTSLAQVEILRDYNWVGAEEDFKRAQEVEPDYIPAHLSYALHLLTARGRFAEARAQLTYADASAKTLGTGLTKAAADYFSRRYESSARQSNRSEISFTLPRSQWSLKLRITLPSTYRPKR